MIHTLPWLFMWLLVDSVWGVWWFPNGLEQSLGTKAISWIFTTDTLKEANPNHQNKSMWAHSHRCCQHVELVPLSATHFAKSFTGPNLAGVCKKNCSTQPRKDGQQYRFCGRLPFSSQPPVLWASLRGACWDVCRVELRKVSFRKKMCKIWRAVSFSCFYTMWATGTFKHRSHSQPTHTDAWLMTWIQIGAMKSHKSLYSSLNNSAQKCIKSKKLTSFLLVHKSPFSCKTWVRLPTSRSVLILDVFLKIGPWAKTSFLTPVQPWLVGLQVQIKSDYFRFVVRVA